MFFIDRKLPIEQKGLYCTWIRRSELPGAPLVAVWIDPAISVFEKDATREDSPTEGVPTCEDGGEQIDSPTRAQGTTGPGGCWHPVVRGLAAMPVWALVAIVAQEQTSERITGMVGGQSNAVIPGTGDQRAGYQQPHIWVSAEGAAAAVRPDGALLVSKGREPKNWRNCNGSC